MATVTIPAKHSAAIRSALTNQLHSVARQPILDLHGRVHAFKLLFRDEPEPGGDGAPANSAMRETAGIFGLHKPSELKKLTGKLKAFVNCSRETLSEEFEQVLPATLSVLEIEAAVEPSPEQIGTYRTMKLLGFRFALDNFTGEREFEPLVELADYVKVDFGATAPGARRELIERLHGKAIAMLAKKVETQAEYRQACEEGFSLFEGYYFCQPVTTRNRRPPANQMLRLEILHALQQNPMNLHKISQLVKRDGPLAFQLLRMVNSPLYAVRQAVESIQAALVAVGEDAFRRIATLAIATEFNGDQPAEILCMAMVRGRFCEAGAMERDLDSFGQYLLGLLSLLPAMQGRPMSELAPALPLSDEVRGALMGTKNRERALLSWLENCERGDWAGCDAAAQANGLNQEKLAQVYVEAVEWAEATLHSAG
jgi:c-di-GMP-related signal transduction protein